METLKIMGVSDVNVNAPGMMEARKHGIPTCTDYTTMITDEIEIIIEATGDETVFDHIRKIKPKRTVVIPGSIAKIMMLLIEEKEELILKLQRHQHELDIILNSTHDGMIAVNKDGEITLFNKAAERMTGHAIEEVLGKKIQETIMSTRLDQVLKSGLPEINQEQVLANQNKIITNRVPVINEAGEVIGAVAVFRDITDITSLTQEVSELKQTQSLLEAIINSSDDAISVVDEKGVGLMINPAYTRITGLKAEEVLGKPAYTDIYEGESMHLKVLKTGVPVRGAAMKVGKQRKDVLVNVAPVYVDDSLKGSVGIIHDISEIKRLTTELNRARRIIRTLEAKYTFDEIIGTSDAMILAIEQAKRAASTPATVLLRGESGTGKELFAHAIHNASERKFNQFVRVNCAAISKSLLESELFGYEEGAFTGAKRGGKKGLFEEADGGTIFLDEIGELPLETQAKLLRVLQEKEIVRVGGTKSIPVNVRIIAATNLHLERAIQQGQFREDLYYRINVLPIHIPPLRYRQADIQDLTEYFIQKFNVEYGRKIESVTPEAVKALATYDWPGNVRELENVISRAIIHMRYSEDTLSQEHLPVLKEAVQKEGSGSAMWRDQESPPTLEEALLQTEYDYIRNMLEYCQGNKSKAARLMNISVRNLYYKLEKLNLQ